METAELGIRQIFLTIQRKSSLIIGVIFIAISIGASHLYLSKPLYSSTALVLFDPRDKNLLDPNFSSDTGNQASARVDSEVEFIRSDAVLLETMQQTPLAAELKATLPFIGIARTALATLGLINAVEKSAAQMQDDMLAKLRRETTIKRLGATYVIAITANSEDPHLAASIANGLAETYISAQLRHKVANLDSHRTVLARHLELARASLLSADAERARLLSVSLDSVSGQAAETTPNPEFAAKLYDVEHSADLARAQYQTLIRRLQDLSAQTDLQVADSHIISAGIVPLRPFSPDHGLILTLSLLAGLTAGITLALLYERLIGGFFTDEQMASALKLSDATALPRARSHTDADSVAELIVDEPNSPFTKAIRRLRATLTLSARAHFIAPNSGLVIMVCSAAHGEGKTTLAVALARCFARSGAKTLLIDGDLRNPGVHRHLKIGPSLALINQLTKPAPDADLFHLTAKDPLTSLRVILGTERENISATDLLSDDAFEHVIAKARSHFDLVIIDTPALGELADALYVAPLAQVALLVTKWATTPQHSVKKCLQALRTAGHPPLLVVPVLSQQNETRVRPWFQLRRYSAEI